MRIRPLTGRTAVELAFRSIWAAAVVAPLSTIISLAFLAAVASLSFSDVAIAADPPTTGTAPSSAQKPKSEPARATSPSAKTPPSLSVSRPRWAELTPAQQLALQPLAAEWDRIDGPRKKKWLEIGSKFGNLKPDQQARLQERMREWAKLTPAQRRVARESYSRTKKLNSSEKSAEWQHYQQLPEDQKKKLAEEASVKKRVANLPPASQQKPKVNPPPKSALKADLQKRQAGQKSEHHPVSPAQGSRAPTNSANPPAGSAPSRTPPVQGGKEAQPSAVPPPSNGFGVTVTPSPMGSPGTTSATQTQPAK
jgi:hypothetical protein